MQDDTPYKAAVYCRHLFDVNLLSAWEREWVLQMSYHVELSGLEQQVLRLLFCSERDDHKRWTDRNIFLIGQSFGLTEEGIRFCKNRALRKIAKASQAGRLPYWAHSEGGLNNAS